jgi:hypothetical protein
MRSAASPEQIVYDLELPQGAELRPAADGAAEIVRGEEVIATVSAPVAWDADGEDVPVEMAAEAKRLTITVPHRDRDLRYPLLVDPELDEDWVWTSGEKVGYAGWQGFSNTSGTFDSAYLDLPGRWGKALYVFTRNGSYVPAGDWSGFMFDPPGGTTYVYSADLYGHMAGPGSCLWRGIYGGTPTSVCSPVQNDLVTVCGVSCGSGSGNAGAYAYAQLQSTTSSTRTDGTKAIAAIQEAYVAYSETGVPTHHRHGLGGKAIQGWNRRSWLAPRNDSGVQRAIHQSLQYVRPGHRSHLLGRSWHSSERQAVDSPPCRRPARPGEHAHLG